MLSSAIEFQGSSMEVQVKCIFFSFNSVNGSGCTTNNILLCLIDVIGQKNKHIPIFHRQVCIVFMVNLR